MELKANSGIVEDMQIIGPRKSRAAAAGVAELMRSLKPRKRHFTLVPSLPMARHSFQAATAFRAREPKTGLP